MKNKTEKLVEVRGLKKHFKISRKEILKAVDGLDFNIYKGETFGLVGESGCGKSTAGRRIMRLYQETEGKVLFKGENLFNNKTAKVFCYKYMWGNKAVFSGVRK